MGDSLTWSILKSATVVLILYSICLAVHRLYLSPIARFPGPKLAAVTKWYEFYYDVVLRGQFTFQIQRLHKQYGPIIRINPYEIHIQDSDFWDELYAGNKDYDRYPWILGRFGNNSNTSTTIRSEHHAMLRAPLNPLFSKRSVNGLRDLLVEKVELLSDAIATNFAITDKVLVLNDAFSAFAGDVITTYSLGSCFNQLQSKGFQDNFHAAYEGARKFAHIGLHFPIVFLILKLLPGWLRQFVVPGLCRMSALQKDFKTKITNTLLNMHHVTENETHLVILTELLQSNLPTKEKAPDRLASEIQQLIGAGVETVAWALTTTVFHLLNTPETMQRLQAELDEAIHDSTESLDLRALEKLPYLTAVLKEGLRLSTGVSVRLPRVSPQKPIKYKDWVIPAGVPVSMTTLDTLYDGQCFPDPCRFCPDRWLDGSKANRGTIPSRYLVPFGRGSKMCLGINLAYAELYLSLATIIRRFRLQLHHTDISDVEPKHDFMVPSPKSRSKGVRVTVELR